MTAEQLSGMRVLVTGAGGMVGSRVVADLLDLGAEVTALDLQPVTRWRTPMAGSRLCRRRDRR